MRTSNSRFLGKVFLGGCIAATLLSMKCGVDSPVAAVAQQKSQPETSLASLQAEIERLKKVIPDQSHAMSDVDYHFSNLWFAGKAENWPLADFYWKESVAHMKWAVRIIPVRKDDAGKEINLEDILQSIENSPYMQMGDVIKQKDGKNFESTYRYLVEGCYSCHKASDKPYLRPHIPERPASAMINFSPDATWPK